MINYRNGKIYKMINDINDYEYIGSTCKTLEERKSKHKYQSKELFRTQLFLKTIRELGIEHFNIILIENYPCNSKEELRERENYYIKLLNPKLNTNRAVKKTNQENYQLNKEKLDENHKKYINKNKEKVNKYKNEWGKQNYHCDKCNKDIKVKNKGRHNKTLLHKNK